MVNMFVGKVWKTGSGSLVVTIPEKLVRFVGIKEGELIKVLLKKKPEK